MICFKFKFQADDGCTNDNTNYDVELGEITEFEAVIWQFPDTKKCPMKQCALSFSNRDVATLHFRLMHASTAMSCRVCGELVSAENAQDLLQHYDDKHPNEEHPALKSVS